MGALSKHGKPQTINCDICAVKSLIMAKEDKKTVDQGQAPVPAASTNEQQPRPNRDRYAAMFGEDNPDVDFEDKEARYGRLADERENYRNLRKSGSNLSQALDKNRWIAAMFQDLAEHPDKNPLVWLTENGIDIKAALDDPKVMAQVDEKFKNWQQTQVEGEQAQEAQQKAIDESLNSLASVQAEFGLSDEQFDRMWEHFWDEVFQPAFKGEVSKDTWVALMHAMNYDTDMANAREEAALQARNEKHANKVKNFDERQVPPSFGQGTGRAATPKPTKKRSMSMDFDDMKKWGY